MEQIKQVIRQIISVSEEELNDFLDKAVIITFKRQEILTKQTAYQMKYF
jgi:hypothetical protein